MALPIFGALAVHKLFRFGQSDAPFIPVNKCRPPARRSACYFEVHGVDRKTHCIGEFVFNRVYQCFSNVIDDGEGAMDDWT